MFVFPEDLVHFQFRVKRTTAVASAALSSQSPWSSQLHKFHQFLLMFLPRQSVIYCISLRLHPFFPNSKMLMRSRNNFIWYFFKLHKFHFININFKIPTNHNMFIYMLCIKLEVASQIKSRIFFYYFTMNW